MQLINVNGLSLFGPGSEWFWSMLQFVIVAITLIAIYRQVRLQASAAAIQQIDSVVKDFSSEAMTRHTLDLEVALRDGVAGENVPYGAASTVGDFWEGIGYLVRAGHIDRTLLREAIGNGAQWWWAALAPWARAVRADLGSPTALEHFEWLAGQLAEDERKAGRAVVYDGPHIVRTLDKRIENDRDRIRVAEEVRSVIVRQGSTALVTPAAIATATSPVVEVRRSPPPVSPEPADGVQAGSTERT
jgi:hypothetical protein